MNIKMKNTKVIFFLLEEDSVEVNGLRGDVSDGKNIFHYILHFLKWSDEYFSVKVLGFIKFVKLKVF